MTERMGVLLDEHIQCLDKAIGYTQDCLNELESLRSGGAAHRLHMAHRGLVEAARLIEHLGRDQEWIESISRSNPDLP